MLVNPTVETLLSDDAMASAGTLEIIPLEQPLTLFVWSAMRVVPVRLTEFSITEESFDPNLNPIRAKISLGMRVLNVDDLGFDHPGGRMFLTYLTNKETMAGRVASAALTTLGLGELTDELSASVDGATRGHSAGDVSDRQPLLRLWRAAICVRRRARASRICSGGSCRSPARPITRPSTNTPCSRVTGWTGSPRNI